MSSNGAVGKRVVVQQLTSLLYQVSLGVVLPWRLHNPRTPSPNTSTQHLHPTPPPNTSTHPPTRHPLATHHPLITHYLPLLSRPAVPRLRAQMRAVGLPPHRAVLLVKQTVARYRLDDHQWQLVYGVVCSVWKDAALPPLSKLQLTTAFDDARTKTASATGPGAGPVPVGVVKANGEPGREPNASTPGDARVDAAVPTLLPPPPTSPGPSTAPTKLETPTSAAQAGRGAQGERVRRRHGGAVNCLASWSSIAVTGCTDGTVHVFDTTQRVELAVLSGHACAVTAIQCTGRYIVSAGADGLVRVRINAVPGVHSSNYSPPTKDNEKTPERSAAVPRESDSSASGNGGGGSVAVSAGGTGKKQWVWASPGSKEKQASSSAFVLKGHRAAVTSLDLPRSQDGDLTVCVVWRGFQHTTHRFSSATHRQRLQPTPPQAPLAASGSLDGTVRMWNLSEASSSRSVAELGPAGNGFNPRRVPRVHCVRMTPLGEAVLTGSSDGVVRLWDLGTARIASVSNAHTAAVRDAQFKGGNVVSCSSDRTVCLWDPRKKGGESRGCLRCYIAPTSISPRYCYDIAPLSLLHRPALPYTPTYLVSTRVTTPPTPNPLALALELHGHTGPVTCMDVGGDAEGSMLYTGSSDCTVRVWDIRQAERGAVEVLEGHTDAVLALRRRAPGRLVSVGEDGDVREWELGAGAGAGCGQGALLGHVDGGATCMGVANDGGLLLGAWDGGLHFW